MRSPFNVEEWIICIKGVVFNFGTQRTVLIIALKNDDRLFAAEQSRGTKNRQTEEQMTHWDMCAICQKLIKK